MKLARLFFALALLACAQETLTNDSIIKMVKAGLGEDLIVSMVQRQPGRYSLTTDDLVMLKQLHVSEKVLAAMMSKGAAAPNSGPTAAPPPIPDVPVPLDAAPVAADAARPTDAQILREGSEVKLKFKDDLSSKTAADEDPVNLVLDQDLLAGNTIVVRAGASALARVVHAKKAGMMGKGGELNIRLEYIDTGNGRIKLRGTKNPEGQDKVGTSVALTVLFGPIGLIKHGKNVEVKQGTPLTAYVAEDTPVR